MDINRIRNNVKKFYQDKKKQQLHEHRKNYDLDKYYQSVCWKKTRDYYKLLHPCCEVCERENIVTPTEQIHHLYPFSNCLTDTARWKMLTNVDMLCACCKYHHKLFHKYMYEHNVDSATIDEIISYEESLKKDY